MLNRISSALALPLLGTLFLLATTIATTASAQASALELELEIPRLNVAEYHRPYVAVWISDDRQQRVADITVWYDLTMANQEGTKWLPDIRQWWRRSGRTLDLPVDGVSAATRAPGIHHVSIAATTLSALDAGDYILHVEAAREVGGREHLRVPFSWPLPQKKTEEHNVLIGETQGEHELGHIRLRAIH